MSDFFDDFQSGMDDASNSFGEPWTLNGVAYPSIAIENVDVNSTAILGGRFADVTTSIFVTGATFALSGVAEGSILTVRMTQARVILIGRDGDNNPVLHCGPVGIKTPRR